MDGGTLQGPGPSLIPFPTFLLPVALTLADQPTRHAPCTHPGGLFLSSVTGFQSDSCEDLNHPASAPKPQPSLAPYVARTNISGFVNCSRLSAGAADRSLLQEGTTANTVAVGYGPDLATMALHIDIERADTVVQVDPAVLELGGGNATVPQVRDQRRGLIVCPPSVASMSPCSFLAAYSP